MKVSILKKFNILQGHFSEAKIRLPFLQQDVSPFLSFQEEKEKTTITIVFQVFLPMERTIILKRPLQCYKGYYLGRILRVGNRLRGKGKRGIELLKGILIV